MVHTDNMAIYCLIQILIHAKSNDLIENHLYQLSVFGLPLYNKYVLIIHKSRKFSDILLKVVEFGNAGSKVFVWA